MAPVAYNLHFDHPRFPLLNKFELHVNYDYAGGSVEMGWEGNDFQGGVTYLAPLSFLKLQAIEHLDVDHIPTHVGVGMERGFPS